MLEDLQKRMQAFQRCIEERDRGTAEEILDDDYALVLVYPSRAVMPRDRWLEVLRDYIVHSYEVEAQITDLDGDCGTVLHRARMSATLQGQDRSGVFIISDVWRLREGSWRLWPRHSTPVSAGKLPGAEE